MKIIPSNDELAWRIIESAENRAMACDGPVGGTLGEMTADQKREVRRLLRTKDLTETDLRQCWKRHVARHRKSTEALKNSTPSPTDTHAD